MLRLRLAIEERRADEVTEALEGTGGVYRIVSLQPERSGSGIVLAADVMPSVADRVMDLIREWEVGDSDYLITRQEVVAPHPAHSHLAAGGDFAWIEVMGEARTHARPLGRYLALMAVAAVVAAVGVITDNPILIVGAMAVSPDLLPICAACVGFVGRRFRLAGDFTGDAADRSVLSWAVAAAVAWRLQLTGILAGDFEVHDTALQASITSTTRRSSWRLRLAWRRCSRSRPAPRRPWGWRSRSRRSRPRPYSAFLSGLARWATPGAQPGCSASTSASCSSLGTLTLVVQRELVAAAREASTGGLG